MINNWGKEFESNDLFAIAFSLCSFMHSNSLCISIIAFYENSVVSIYTSTLNTLIVLRCYALVWCIGIWTLRVLLKLACFWHYWYHLLFVNLISYLHEYNASYLLSLSGSAYNLLLWKISTLQYSMVPPLVCGLDIIIYLSVSNASYLLSLSGSAYHLLLWKISGHIAHKHALMHSYLHTRSPLVAYLEIWWRGGGLQM